MSERSFRREVEQLRLGAGQTFHGEAILGDAQQLISRVFGSHIITPIGMPSTICINCWASPNAASLMAFSLKT